MKSVIIGVGGRFCSSPEHAFLQVITEAPLPFSSQSLRLSSSAKTENQNCMYYSIVRLSGTYTVAHDSFGRQTRTPLTNTDVFLCTTNNMVIHCFIPFHMSHVDGSFLHSKYLSYANLNLSI